MEDRRSQGPGLSGLESKVVIMRERYRGNGGFSLVELLIVIAVIGILAATLLLSATEFITKAKFVKTQSTIETLALRLEHFNSEQRQYPGAYELVGDLRGKDRQGVPYYEFNADVLGGPGVSYKSVRIMDAATGTMSTLPVPPGDFVLDAWNQPLYYIPNYQYDDPSLQIPAWNDLNGNGIAEPALNETYYNPASFQCWSAGPDGVVRGVQYGGRLIPAPMPFNDNRDNDGDGLLDREEDAEKANRNDPRNLPEDDIIR
jgi:prepilin-type N-terminal cleavage/methylation domain-containing protein